MKSLENIGIDAKKASKILAKMSNVEKNKVLNLCADAMFANVEYIVAQNKIDIDNAISNGMNDGLLDRLMLDEERVFAMGDGLKAIVLLDDPTAEILSMKTMDNGLIIGQKRVPLGVIGIIYEARPNVSADAFGLVLKAGNSVILRGGKEAINSNKAIVDTFRQTLKHNNYSEDFVQLITDISRETAVEMMKLNKYIDVLIPRGGANLIKSIVANATVPVIETGTGNCHIYIDESANFQNALAIIINAKTQRIGVCNACEKVILHENIAASFLPLMCDALREKGVEIRGDEQAIDVQKDIILATEEDWFTEYLALIIAVKIVKNVDCAIEHIDKYSTGHSEAIITENYTNAQQFLNEVDSAAVYVNASTRFTDGSCFGFGAEIGISTQKLHARGPMGLKELTSTKYIIYGQGNIR